MLYANKGLINEYPKISGLGRKYYQNMTFFKLLPNAVGISKNKFPVITAIDFYQRPH